MKNVLLTGGTGFIGRNIKPYLENICNLYTPNRYQLNLYNEDDVKDYIKKNKIEIVIHSANPNPVKNQQDHQERMFEDSIRMFMNLFRAKDLYEIMYTLGSGAEFNKSKDISSVSEAEEFRSVPYDSYGLAKYTINHIVSSSDKHCNLRIFACYGPADHESKFITHCINCCKNNETITIRQNCYFDYMQVMDLAKILEYFIYNKPKHHSYNICTGERTTLYEIAKMVREQMQTTNEIVFLNEGWNKEYTASNKRLLNELGTFKFIPLKQGIKIQIDSELGRGM